MTFNPEKYAYIVARMTFRLCISVYPEKYAYIVAEPRPCTDPDEYTEKAVTISSFNKFSILSFTKLSSVMMSEKPCCNLSVVRNLSTPLKLSTVLFLSLAIASCDSPSYANTVHPHGELALAGYVVNGAYSPLRAFFMRNISMHSHIFMARLERDTFECAGNRLHLSANPFQLCHPHLAVNGKASFKVNGAHTHA